LATVNSKQDEGPKNLQVVITVYFETLAQDMRCFFEIEALYPDHPKVLKL